MYITKHYQLHIVRQSQTTTFKYGEHCPRATTALKRIIDKQFSYQPFLSKCGCEMEQKGREKRQKRAKSQGSHGAISTYDIREAGGMGRVFGSRWLYR